MEGSDTSSGFTLAPEEKIISVVRSLNFSMGGSMNWDYTPYKRVTDIGDGVLTLTTFRLVASFGRDTETQQHYYSFSAILAYSEKYPFHTSGFLGGTWPYEAELLFPGGVMLKVKAHHKSPKPKLEEYVGAAKPIASLLAKSFFLLSKQHDDDSVIAATINYEERRKRD